MADLHNQTSETDVPVKAETKLLKRAVVVIHGIGNQSPMATLRELVESVWTRCPDLVKVPPPLTPIY